MVTVWAIAFIQCPIIYIEDLALQWLTVCSEVPFVGRSRGIEGNQRQSLHLT